MQVSSGFLLEHVCPYKIGKMAAYFLERNLGYIRKIVKNSSKTFYFIKLEMVIGNILDKLDRLFYKHWSGLNVLRAKNWRTFEIIEKYVSNKKTYRNCKYNIHVWKILDIYAHTDIYIELFGILREILREMCQISGPHVALWRLVGDVGKDVRSFVAPRYAIFWSPLF